MEEAKFSANIKFRHLGFECQFTMRQDEGPAAQVMEMQMQAVKWLWAHGATPNGNGHAAAPGAEHPPAPPAQLEHNIFTPPAPVCPVCGQADELELVSFERDGKPRKAWKCHRCEKWLPSKK